MWNSSVMPVQRAQSERSAVYANVEATLDTKVRADEFFNKFGRVEAAIVSLIGQCPKACNRDCTV